MLKSFIYFIKYNNIAVLAVLAVFLLAGGALATETGQEIIGGKQTSLEGVDNALLLAADLEKLDMEFRIEKIEEDDKMYYVTYTYMDLAEVNGVWRYQIKENTRLVSKKLKKDLGQYLAEEFSEEYGLRIKELKQAQAEARERGETKKVEVVEYTGLIGRALDAAGRVFSGYEPVKKRELIYPMSETLLGRLAGEDAGRVLGQAEADDLTKVYNDFISENDPDKDSVFYFDDNCPTIYNPDQLDSDLDGVGDACDIDNMNTAGEEIATGTESKLQIPIRQLEDKLPASAEATAGKQNTNSEGRGTSQDNPEAKVEVIDLKNKSEGTSNINSEPVAGDSAAGIGAGAGEAGAQRVNNPAQEAEPVQSQPVQEVQGQAPSASSSQSGGQPGSIFGAGETEMVVE